MALNNPAGVRSKPDLLSFRDQVTDGEHQAIVADHYPIACPLRAQDFGCEGIGRHLGGQTNDRRESPVKIVDLIIGFGLQGSRQLPALVERCHRRPLHPQASSTQT